MDVERFPTPAAFLDAAGEHLAAREAFHNRPLSTARTCRDRPDRFPGPNIFAVARTHGRVVGVALLVPPHRLQLYAPAGPATTAIAADLARDLTVLPGVHGPTDAAVAFATAWCAGRGLAVRHDSDLRAFELVRVIPAAPTPGAMRPAGDGDLPLVAAWYEALTAEIGPQAGSTPGDAARRAVRDGLVVVWDDTGPVAQAAVVGTTPHGTRIGAVYTPPEQRRRGYATALVAALSQRLLDEGQRFCFLFTDLANPVSNAIYPKIGYRAVADYRNLDFVSP